MIQKPNFSPCSQEVAVAEWQHIGFTCKRSWVRILGWAETFLLLLNTSKSDKKCGDQEVSCATSSFIYLDNTLGHKCQLKCCNFLDLQPVSPPDLKELSSVRLWSTQIGPNGCSNWPRYPTTFAYSLIQAKYPYNTREL